MNLTTRSVSEMLEGSIGNMSDEEMDNELKLFNKIARELSVPKSKIDDMVAVIDEDYEMELDKVESPYYLDERNGIHFVFFKDEQTADSEIQAQQERNAEYEK